MKGTVSYLNPEGLHKNPVYSQVVATKGPVRTIYVGGQNAVDTTGIIVGNGDIAAQAARVAKNLRVALAATGARAEHVVKSNVYLVQGQRPEPAMSAFQQVIGPLPHAPTNTVLYVSGLANQDYLLEVDAIADVKTTYDPDNVFHHNQNISPRLSDDLALRAQAGVRACRVHARYPAASMQRTATREPRP